MNDEGKTLRMCVYANPLVETYTAPNLLYNAHVMMTRTIKAKKKYFLKSVPGVSLWLFGDVFKLPQTPMRRPCRIISTRMVGFFPLFAPASFCDLLGEFFDVFLK